MRTTLSILTLLALAPGLSAAQQTITVTPQTLTGWTVVGADPQALSKQLVLSLPAGAQLTHSFKATEVALKVTTSPVIGSDTADFPVLEIGPATLIFTRDGSAGKLVLLLGDNAPLDLPFTFALDANGRSTEPLTIGFSRQGTLVIIEMSGQTLQFPAGPAPETELEVVASAGTTQAWDFTSLEVTVSAPSTDGSNSWQSTNAPGSNATNAGNSTKTVRSSAETSPIVLGGTSAPASGPSAPVPTDAFNPKSTLEIFTPPSVRHGRVDAIRAALAPAKNQ